MRLLETLLVATATCAAAYDLPDKLRQIYDKHKISHLLHFAPQE